MVCMEFTVMFSRPRFCLHCSCRKVAQLRRRESSAQSMERFSSSTVQPSSSKAACRYSCAFSKSPLPGYISPRSATRASWKELSLAPIMAGGVKLVMGWLSFWYTVSTNACLSME